jgi:hypothetical protein
VALPAGEPYLINPGAVGQSRDGTVHASFAVMDLERSVVTYLSLPYDSESTLEKLRRAGLVAKVVVGRAQGAARYLENARLRMVRRRAQSAPRNGNGGPLVAPERSPIAWPPPPRRQRLLRSTQRGLQMLGADRISVPGKSSPTATVLLPRHRNAGCSLSTLVRHTGRAVRRTGRVLARHRYVVADGVAQRLDSGFQCLLMLC